MNINFNPYSTSGQIVVMLLSVFLDQKGSLSKQDVIQFLSDRDWFSFGDGDSQPYPSCKTKEPRWKTFIAFRRKDCVDCGLFEDDKCNDTWEISKVGRNEFVRIRQLFQSGEWDCCRCYMWSPSFKKFIDPSYRPSPKDEPRPPGIYDDLKPKNYVRLEDL